MNNHVNGLLKKIRYILKGFRGHVIYIVFLLFIGMIFEMTSIGIIIPVLGILLNNDFLNKYPELIRIFKKIGLESQTEIIYFTLFGMLFVFFLKTIFMAYLSWKQANFSAQLSSKTSSKLYRAYLSQPYSFHLLKNSTELTRNIVGEVHEFSEMLKSVFVLTVELVAMIGIAIILLIQEPMGTIGIFLVLGISTLALQKLTSKKLSKWGILRQNYDGLMKKKLNHGLLGIKDIKLKGNEQVFLDEFNYYNFKRVDVVSKQYALTFFPRLYLEFLAVLGLVGFIYFKIYMGVELNLILPTIAIFIAGAFRLIPSVNRIIGSLQYVKYSIPVIDVIYNEILFTDNINNQTFIEKGNLNFNNNICLEDISFKYEETDTEVLQNINFKINKGEILGFIGTSGSGKSTLIDIILGLLTPTKGKIKLDGIEINSNNNSWRTLVGYVPQNIFLADDNIRNNIAFGITESCIDDEAINRSIIGSHLYDFINELPDGLDTIVGEQGVRLSGGQRQRIGLARALYYDPQILVLDEATSALDTQTESYIMDTVFELKNSKTILLVAHRLSTLKNCDKIIKLEKGQIKHIGTPSEVI